MFILSELTAGIWNTQSSTRAFYTFANRTNFHLIYLKEIEHLKKVDKLYSKYLQPVKSRLSRSLSPNHNSKAIKPLSKF